MGIIKVISGGQTGCDQMALTIAAGVGLETGGTAPKGWLTEDGPAPWLKDLGLTQSPSANYSIRTKDNIRDSDATLILGHDSPGSLQTMHMALELKKPWRWIKVSHLTPESLTYLYQWIGQMQIQTLNIAGNRASVLKAKGGAAEIKKFLRNLLAHYQEEE